MSDDTAHGRVDAYTVEQVAVRLQVERKSVYELVRRGELRATRVGRLIRIPARELQRFLAGAT